MHHDLLWYYHNGRNFRCVHSPPLPYQLLSVSEMWTPLFSRVQCRTLPTLRSRTIFRIMYGIRPCTMRLTVSSAYGLAPLGIKVADLSAYFRLLPLTRPTQGLHRSHPRKGCVIRAESYSDMSKNLTTWLPRWADVVVICWCKCAKLLQYAPNFLATFFLKMM